MRKKLYICDKKPGACRGWEGGWKQCENDMCFHTSNRKHRKYKGGRYVTLKGSNARWQIMNRCCHIRIFSPCKESFEVIYCLRKECKKSPEKDNDKHDLQLNASGRT